MNKTVTINLSGQVFQIDEDAYEKLKGYLDSIHARFAGTEGAEEIMADIEARLAEMFLANLGDKKNVISISHVDNVMQVMGKPEDFGDVDDAEEKQKSRTWSASVTFGTKTGKKLYRDEDNKILGGVISGLCAYLGINDPVWMRLATAILFLVSGGTVFILYLILWIIVPKAVTASEKLEMKGEPINIDNIERTIREDIEDIKNRIHNMDKNSAKEKMRSIFLDIAAIFLQIFRGILHMLRRLIGVVLIIVAMCVLIGLIWSWWIPGQQVANGYHLLPYFYNTQSQITLALVGISLLVFIPIVALVLLGFRLLFYRSYRGHGIGGVLVVLWVVGWILTPIALGNHHRDNSYKRDKTEQIPVVVPASHMIRLVAINDNNNIADQYQKLLHLGPFRITGDSIYETGNNNLRLDIAKSTSGDFYIEKDIAARSSSSDDAYVKASHVVCNITQTDSTLYFVNNIRFPAADKIRGQEVHITVHVPEGDSVFLDPSILDIMFDVKNVTEVYDGDMVGHTWTMRPEGLTCVGCTDLGKTRITEKYNGNIHEYTPGDFTKINVSGVFDVNVRKGDKAKVEVSGPEQATKNVVVKTSGKTLNISSDEPWYGFLHRNKKEKVIIDITVPKLDNLEVSGASDVTMKDFSGDELNVDLSGASHADLDVKEDKLTVDASGACDMTLTGSARELDTEISGACSLNGFGFEAHKAKVEATGACHARVKVIETLEAHASGASDVEYDGSPVISSDASGFSSIKPKR